MLVHYGDLQIAKLKSSDSLPQIILGDFKFEGEILPQSVNIPKVVNGHFEMPNLEHFGVLYVPSKATLVNLHSLKTVERLIFRDEVLDGGLYLTNLIDYGADVLRMPKVVNGTVDMQSLNNIKGIVFPEEISGNLLLSQLKNADDFVFAINLKGDFNAHSLKSARNTVFPYKVRQLMIGSLVEAINTTFPKELDQAMAPSLVRIENSTLPLRIKSGFYTGNLKLKENLPRSFLRKLKKVPNF